MQEDLKVKIEENEQVHMQNYELKSKYKQFKD